jgi:hypothetical protein
MSDFLVFDQFASLNRFVDPLRRNAVARLVFANGPVKFYYQPRPSVDVIATLQEVIDPLLRLD